VKLCVNVMCMQRLDKLMSAGISSDIKSGAVARKKDKK